MHNLLAVFGCPILHSKSPLMFNSLLGGEDLYTRIRVNSSSDLVDAIKTLNLKGANVTAPFKEEIIPLLDQLSEEVQFIGGANTICNKEGKLIAYNTDWYGATEAIKLSGLSIKGLKVVLLGLGGAGKAVAYGLLKEGADVTLVNRTASKAKTIANKLGCQYQTIENLPTLLNHTELFVSAILPGSKLDNLQCIPKNIWVFDANYHGSLITQMAIAGGNPTIDAKKWLLHQAIKSYEHIFDAFPNIQKMEKALESCTTAKINVVGVCNEPDKIEINSELILIPKNEASNYIRANKPDLVIYTPNLGIKEVEEIYAYERNKALER